MRILRGLGRLALLLAALALALRVLTQAPVRPAERTGSVYHVGDIVKLRTHTLRVTDVWVDYKSPSPRDKPQSREHCFVVARVTIWNTGDAELPVNSLAFELDDGEPVRHQVTLVVGLEHPLESTTLSPGEWLSANLAFESRRDRIQRTLVYRGDLVGDAELAVDLTASPARAERRAGRAAGPPLAHAPSHGICRPHGSSRRSRGAS